MGDAVQAWYLPPGIAVSPSQLREIAGGGSALLRAPVPSGPHMSRWISTLRSGQRALAVRLWRDTAHTIGTVAERLLDPEDDLRSSALRDLECTTTLSAPMAERVLDGMAVDWVSNRLVGMVEAEPRLADALDGLVPGPNQVELRARGYPLTVHIGAGSVPGVSATSMIRALLVKSAVLIKPGAGDVALTVCVARAIADADPVLGAALAVLYWPGSDTTEQVLQAADLVVVYGDDSTVRSVRSRVKAPTPVVAYPHRLSLGVVAREALIGDGAVRTANALATAVAMFDQRGCVSPHLVYVERDGVTDPGAWGELGRASTVEVVHRAPFRPVEHDRGLGYPTAQSVQRIARGSGRSCARDRFAGSGLDRRDGPGRCSLAPLPRPDCHIVPDRQSAGGLRKTGGSRVGTSDGGLRRPGCPGSGAGGGPLCGGSDSCLWVRRSAVPTAVVDARRTKWSGAVDQVDRLGNGRLS